MDRQQWRGKEGGRKLEREGKGEEVNVPFRVSTEHEATKVYDTSFPGFTLVLRPKCNRQFSLHFGLNMRVKPGNEAICRELGKEGERKLGKKKDGGREGSRIELCEGGKEDGGRQVRRREGMAFKETLQITGMS